MARIPQTELDRVNREVDLLALIQSKGLECVKSSESELSTRCPFHKEDNPGTLIITPSVNSWHCADCGKKGSAIDFVMAYEGMSQRYAYEIISSGNIKALMRTGPPIGHATMLKLPSPVDFDADESTILAQAISFYHERLKQSPVAMEYLHKRGLTDEAIEHFKIGYADRTLGLRLPNGATRIGTVVRDKLKKVGLMREESGHEHFSGSVVFPIMDDSGRIVQAYARKITYNLRKGTPDHLYSAGPHVGIFNGEALKTSRQIVLCESIIDALSFWCAGFKNTTCIFGTDGFTDGLFQSLIKNKIERIFLAYDRDEAGDQAAKRDAPKLLAKGIEVYRVKFPQSMDANSYAVKVKPADASFRALIESAEWLGKARMPKRVPVAVVEVANEVPVVLPEIISVPVDAPVPVDVPVPVSPVVAVAPIPEPESAPAPKKPSDWEPVRQGEDVIFDLGYRNYRVRGLDKNNSSEVMRINLRVMHNGLYHVNVLDLYQAKQRNQFIDDASKETLLEPELIKRDLGKLLLALETLQQQRLQEALNTEDTKVPTMTPEEEAEAMGLLRDPRLLERIVTDFAITGESTNKLAGYLGTVSRLLDRPLAIIIQSTSAAGKSSLMEAVLAMMPPESVIKYSAMTGQSLYYLGENDLKNRILAIVEEEGAAKASYALKLLQSEGELIIASTSKDDQGRMKTEEYRVEGPVMLFLTTTAIDIDEELLNRCFVLTVDESRQQTEAIHHLQRAAETLDGLQRKMTLNGVFRVHRNAQRLLRSIPVVNPFAPRLTFMSDRTRTRRDHVKYLTLIRTVALLHQYQREIKVLPDGTQYIEATLQDISAANAIAHELLGRSLDELPPQTRKLLGLLESMVESICTERKIDRASFHFSRRDVRSALGWGDTQLKLHLHRLVDMEFLALRRHPFGGQRHLYELLYTGKSDTSGKFLPGLIDPESLYDANRSGQSTSQSGSGRPLVGPLSGGGRTPGNVSGCQ